MAAVVTSALALILGVDERQIELTADQRRRLRELLPIFRQVGEAEGVPWSLLAGIARVESGFNPDALGPLVGRHRGHGLMQIMLPLHEEAGTVPKGWNWRDPAENIRAGARILKNSGFGRTTTYQALARYGGHIKTDPRPYVSRVLGSALEIERAYLAGELQ